GTPQGAPSWRGRTGKDLGRYGDRVRRGLRVGRLAAALRLRAQDQRVRSVPGTGRNRDLHPARGGDALEHFRGPRCRQEPMTNIVLLRHGLTAMTGPRLAGWTPGISLDERGIAQAQRVAERLAPLPLAAIVSSPLERCQETAAAVAEGRGLTISVDERIGECRYGDWTGQELKVLAKDPLWKVVQNNPSAVVFPGPEGEALRDTQARAVTALREWDAKIAAEAGPDATWLACSHGDVIKAVVADALGMHLDLFQRINVDPCSVTVIRYAELRSFALRVNDNGGSIEDLLPPKKKSRSRRKPSSDAVVGGGAGA